MEGNQKTLKEAIIASPAGFFSQTGVSSANPTRTHVPMAELTPLLYDA
jgi:hypothetical protein